MVRGGEASAGGGAPAEAGTTSGGTASDEARDEAELLRIDADDHALAVLGAVRELEALLAIYQSFGRTYTYEELQAAEAEYWQARLTRQAEQSLMATGSPGAGNVEALKQIEAVGPNAGAGRVRC